MSKRVETGPVQFGDDDWPGVFIRGDDAAGFAQYLDRAISALERTDLIGASVLRGLQHTLRSCDVRLIEGSAPIADLRRAG